MALTKKVMGIISFSAFNGLHVYEWDEDKIQFKAFRTGETGLIHSKLTIAKVKFNNNGDAYFFHQGRRILLNEIMRTNF